MLLQGMISSRAQLRSGAPLPEAPHISTLRPTSHTCSQTIMGQEKEPPSWQTDQDLEPGWDQCGENKYQDIYWALLGRRKEEARVENQPTVSAMIRRRAKAQARFFMRAPVGALLSPSTRTLQLDEAAPEPRDSSPAKDQVGL